MFFAHYFVYVCAVALLCPTISSACSVGNVNVVTRIYSTLYGATLTIPCNIKVDLLSHLQFDVNGFSKLYIKVDSCSIWTTTSSFYIKVKKENGKIEFTDYVYDSSTPTVHPQIYSNLRLISNDSCNLRFTNIDILKIGEKFIPENQFCPFSSFVFFNEISSGQPCPLADRIDLKVQGLPVDPPSNLSVISTYGMLAENSENFVYAGDFITCYFNSTKDSVFPKNIDGSNMTYTWSVNGVLQNENSYQYQILKSSGIYQCTATYTSYDNQYSWNIQSNNVEVTVIYGPENLILNDYYEANEGDDLKISCKVSSHPAADFLFSDVGYSLTSPNEIVWYLKDVQRSQNGSTLSCIALNPKTLKSITKTCIILVYYGPQTMHFDKFQYFNEGEDAEFICTVESYPTSDFSHSDAFDYSFGNIIAWRYPSVSRQLNGTEVKCYAYNHHTKISKESVSTIIVYYNNEFGKVTTTEISSSTEQRIRNPPAPATAKKLQTMNFNLFCCFMVSTFCISIFN